MVRCALERLGNSTCARYEIHMATGELLRITRRNKGLEWAKFTVRDPLIGLYYSHFLTVNHPHKESTFFVILSNSILAMWALGATAQWFFHYASEDFHFLKKSILDDDRIDGDRLSTSDRFTPRSIVFPIGN